MKVFIVVHHEVMGTTDNPRCDEMQFYTASSLKKALAMIKKVSVSKWSWWEIQSQELDETEWPKHIGYYGLRGGKLAEPPWEKCLALFKEARKRGDV